VIVVDTQILVYAALRTPESATVDAVQRRDDRWVTSTLWASEFRNVLAGYLRRGAFQVGDALRFFEVAEVLLERELSPDTSRVFSLIASSSCTAYDLEFVAVAESLGVPLITNDRRILADFPAMAVTPAAFAGS
jgi:predicted nucleic acid-binding protein